MVVAGCCYLGVSVSLPRQLQRCASWCLLVVAVTEQSSPALQVTSSLLVCTLPPHSWCVLYLTNAKNDGAKPESSPSCVTSPTTKKAPYSRFPLCLHLCIPWASLKSIKFWWERWCNDGAKLFMCNGGGADQMLLPVTSPKPKKAAYSCFPLCLHLYLPCAWPKPISCAIVVQSKAAPVQCWWCWVNAGSALLPVTSPKPKKAAYSRFRSRNRESVFATNYVIQFVQLTTINWVLTLQEFYTQQEMYQCY